MLMRPEFREALESDLRRLHARTGPWDVVFLTGNVTQQGSPREFTLLNSTLNSLWDYFRSLGSNPLLLTVPGERDFWAHDTFSSQFQAEGASGIRKVLRQSLITRSTRFVLTGFRGYTKWFAGWRSQHSHSTKFLEGLLPGDFATTVMADGLKVGVVGLNSVLRANEGNPGSEREVDIEQVEAAVDPHSWALQHDLLVLLTHAPPRSLSPKSLDSLYERLAPSNRPLLHLCGGFHLKGWKGPGPAPLKNAHGSRAFQALPLFGDTEVDSGNWGYAAGTFSSSASRVQLFPRRVLPSKDPVVLGPDSLQTHGETFDIPLAALLRAPSAQASAERAAQPLEDRVTSDAVPLAEDDASQELHVQDDEPELSSFPPGIRLHSIMTTGQQPVSRLAWSPAGEALGIGFAHGELAYWKLGEQRASRTSRVHTTEITGLCFLPDGEALISRSQHHIRLWRTSSLSEGELLFTTAGFVLACSSSGLLAADVVQGNLLIWNTRTQKVLGELTAPAPLSPVNCLAWSHNEPILACGASGAGVSPCLLLWRLKGEQTLHAMATVRMGHAVLDIAWMPHSSLMALARVDGTILLLDAAQNRVVARLEGHTAAVLSVSFSGDGRLLASQSENGTVLLFRTDTWEQVAKLENGTVSISGSGSGRGLAFSPTGSLLALVGADDRNIWICDIDADVLLKTKLPSTTVHEVSAKVVLVGEGRAGKSSLALRMAQDRYEEMESTHGMRFWSLPAELQPLDGTSARTQRELILWDMGGQNEYQLVHQLFLRDSTAAVMVMEPGRGEPALEEIEGWNQRLLAHTGSRNILKFLVGSKVDTLDSPQDLQAIQRLVQRCQFTAYVPTSAKTGRGIPELKAALAQVIDWSSLEQVSRPELFQRMRQHLQQLRGARRVVLTFSQLEAELRREMGNDFDPDVLRSVVGPLTRQGLVADTRLADGTRVLILEVEQVERYAGSLILAARDNLHGVPAIDVAKVLSPAMKFPRLPPEERLPRDQELLVLDCVIELLLEHGLCLRHEGLLIFPSLFRPTQAETGQELPHAISLHYDFSGPIDNIYASLVTSLALSRRFGPMRLWQDRAEFGRAGQDSSGVRRMREGRQGARGHARLDVYFDPETPRATRELFVNIIEEHLREHGVELLERLSITCACGRVFAEDVVRERLHAGHLDIGCPGCDHRTPLTLGAQQARERNPELHQQVRALRTDIQEQRFQSITETKVSITEAKTVKTPSDTPLRILHLSDLHVGASMDPLSLLQPLEADLKDRYDGLGVDRLDYLVISGDITNRAAPQEFENARKLVSALIERFGLTSERCILVPGNHDLDWDTEVYTRKKKRQVDARTLVPGTYKEDGDGYYVRDEAKYPERFKNFSQHFYHPLTQRPYPLAAEEQCLSFLFSESRVQFLAMNSAWEIDEYFTERSSISERALSRGLESAHRELAEARKRGDLKDDAQVLRIAVWHHPITGNEKIQADSFMGRLLQADVRACLHGHVHEDRADLVNYLHPGRRLHVVGAGSFGAPTHHRPESVPRLFNLLELQRDLKRMRVHTRCLRRQGGAWEGWAVWPGERPGDKRTYYEVTLP
jgi:small GTP-binding protein